MSVSVVTKSPSSNGKGSKSHQNGKSESVDDLHVVWKIEFVSVHEIAPSPYQPRLVFDDTEMEELTASVRQRGVQQPVIVRTWKEPSNAGSEIGQGAEVSHETSSEVTEIQVVYRYELVAGERRLRACRAANRPVIPVIVRDDLTDAEAAELGLLENVQRSNLTCIEEARGYKRLMLQFRMKEERIAKKVGKSVHTIRELMKLLKLPEPVQVMLWEKKLNASHAHALLPLASFQDLCIAVAQYAFTQGLTATELGANVLPNGKALVKQNLLVELNYQTKFDWKEACGNCAFKAYFPGGYFGYCAKPEEWQKKQEAAIQLKEEEAAKVMEQARQDNNGVIDIDQLPMHSYRDLTFASDRSELPAGCNEQCPCRRNIADEDDPTKKRPVCLDPARYQQMVKEQRQGELEARQRSFRRTWDTSVEGLKQEVASGDFRMALSLMAWPCFQYSREALGDEETLATTITNVGLALDVGLPWPALMEADEDEFYAILLAALSADGEEVAIPLEDPHPEGEPAMEVEEQALRFQVTLDRLLMFFSSLLLAAEAQVAITHDCGTPAMTFLALRGRPRQEELQVSEELSPNKTEY